MSEHKYPDLWEEPLTEDVVREMYSDMRDELIKAKAEIERLLAEREWRPIKDAPKDEDVLAYSPIRGGMRVTSWNKHINPCTGKPFGFVGCTHWMPQPPIPDKQGGGS